MKDVTLRSGQTMTDAEFIRERGFGDTLTEFAATKADLKSLAIRLVEEELEAEFFLRLETSRFRIEEMKYLQFRLERVMDFLPEFEVEVREKMRLGLEKNEKDAQEYFAECAARYAADGASKLS